VRPGNPCPLCRQRIRGNLAMWSHLMGHARREEMDMPTTTQTNLWGDPAIGLRALIGEALKARKLTRRTG